MKLFRRMLVLFGFGRTSREIDREVAFHISERTDALVTEGMDKKSARREAERLFGNPFNRPLNRNRTGVFGFLESLIADLRYAFRSLRKSPVFVLVAVVSLGLGIGANTAIFSLYNALVLRTLPVEEPGELVQIAFEGGRTSFTNPLWEEFRDRQDLFDHVFAFGNTSFDLADGGQARWVRGYWVSGDFFNTLQVQPIAGRLVTKDDDYRGCPGVAMVSYGFWQREYGGSLEAIGGTIRLNGQPFELVGVVDPSFSGVDVGRDIEVYTPICSFNVVNPTSKQLDRRSSWWLRVLGRNESNTPREQLDARLAALSLGVFNATIPDLWDAEGQERYRNYTFSSRDASNGLSFWRNRYQQALLVLMTLVGVVLLIACANVANLLLARATNRAHEISIRRAIGSGRGRLIRLLLSESLLLSFASVIVALLFAEWASAFLVKMISPNNTLWLNLDLDLRVFGFAIAVAVITGVLFGLLPAWRASGVVPQAALRTAGREATDRRGRFSLGKILVVGQLALSLALLVGAGLLIGSLTRLTSVDTGFNRDGVLLVTIDKRNADFSPAETNNVDRQLLERMRGLPGVLAASSSRLTPIGGSSWNNYLQVDGFEPLDPDDQLVWFNTVTDGFFTTLETPLLAGRDFDSRDVVGSGLVAIVNETLALRFFGERHPLGRTFRMTDPGEEPETYEVIGVVSDSKYDSLDEVSLAIAYFPKSQQDDTWRAVSYQLRTAGPPTGLVSAVAEVVTEAHPRISIRFSTLADDVAESLTRPRILAVLSGFFGAVALVLAMIGLYGTLAYRVTNRRGEIGVRMALGAARVRVVRMILGEVGWLACIGIGIGVAVALASSRILTSFLFGVSETDVTTLVLSVVVLATVTIVAGAIPAWQAARLDPMEALRNE